MFGSTNSSALPEHCGEDFAADESAILHNKPWILYYVILPSITVVFSIPLVIVMVRRNRPETKARSPILTTLCIGLLMIDAILNTFIFSRDPHEMQRLICLMGVWTTMCINVPILMTMYLRVYRLKRVFELYENYLKTMRMTLGDQLVNRQA